MTENSYLPLFGRILMSAIFILSGVSKILDWSGTADLMASKGIPVVPLFLSMAILVEVVGGASLLFAWKPKWGAWLLFLYLIPVTLTFHNFWALNGMNQINQMAHFMKNLNIMGGLLIVASVPERQIRVGRNERGLESYFSEKRAA